MLRGPLLTDAAVACGRMLTRDVVADKEARALLKIDKFWLQNAQVRLF